MINETIQIMVDDIIFSLTVMEEIPSRCQYLSDDNCNMSSPLDKEDLGHSERPDNKVGTDLMYKVGLESEIHSSPKACVPVHKAGLSSSNFKNQGVRSAGEMEGLKAYQVEPRPNITKGETGGKTSPNEWKKVYCRRWRIKKKSLEEIINREPGSKPRDMGAAMARGLRRRQLV
ncbi:hypothetical protein Ancab_017016 [Ancistrocladus abbreviatus]